MALTAHQIAWVQLPYIAPGFHHFADKLMADESGTGTFACAQPSHS